MYALGESDFNTVTVAAQQLAMAMVKGRQYRFAANVDTWVRVTQAGGAVAAAADGSHLVMAGQQVLLGQLGPESGNVAVRDRVSVLRVGGADGVCTLSEIARMPNG